MLGGTAHRTGLSGLQRAGESDRPRGLPPLFDVRQIGLRPPEVVERPCLGSLEVGQAGLRLSNGRARL